MKIVIVGADKETAANSLLESQKRLDEAKDAIQKANEVMFEAILNLDPDDEDKSVEDRVQARNEIEEAERKANKAYAKYDCALLRYGWECAQARKAGLLD